MIITLHTDTYYRGYRLAHLPNGQVKVYYDADLVETALTEGTAKKDIDSWLNAR